MFGSLYCPFILIFRLLTSENSKKWGYFYPNYNKSILLYKFVLPHTKTGGYKMNFSHLANKLRRKVTKFSGILSRGLDKTARRFVQEAIYGIIASESVMLTEITGF